MSLIQIQLKKIKNFCDIFLLKIFFTICVWLKLKKSGTRKHKLCVYYTGMYVSQLVTRQLIFSVLNDSKSTHNFTYQTNCFYLELSSIALTQEHIPFLSFLFFITESNLKHFQVSLKIFLYNDFCNTFFFRLFYLFQAHSITYNNMNKFYS